MTNPFIDQTLYKQLPAEIMPPRRWVRVWINLLGAIALVFALNWLAILYFQDDYVNRGDYIVRKKWQLVHTMAEPVDWLILGDSSANQGIVPAVVNEAFDASSVNLALVGSWSLVGDAWMLQTYLNRFEPPEGVIIGHVYDVYRRGFNSNLLAQSALEWGAWNTLTPSIDLSFEDEFDFFVTRYFPLYYRVGTLREVMRLFFHEPESLIQEPPFRVDETGYMAIYNARPDNVLSDMGQHQNSLESASQGGFRASDINQQAMDEIIRLADEHQIQVYFVNSPIYDELYTNPLYQDYFVQVDAWLQTMADRSPHVTYVDRVFQFTVDEMETVDHTTHPNSQEYTRGLVEEIEESHPG